MFILHVFEIFNEALFYFEFFNLQILDLDLLGSFLQL